MTNDQSFIQKAREQIFGNQRRRAIERRHEKIEREKEAAEIELFLDAAAAEGLDKNNPRDLAIIMRAWALKKGEQIGDELPDDWDTTPGGPFVD
jgi:hypothetical protein